MAETFKYRRFKDKAFQSGVVVIALVSMLPLFLIIFYISKTGIAAINWDFLTQLPKPTGELGGGVSNAIVGTLIMISIAGLMSIPPAILIGIYLSEYKETKIAGIGRYCLDVLQGVPSIVIGIIVYILLVKPLGGYNALAGSFALALMMIPVVAKATEETLKLIPQSLKEASIALGVPYYKTILKVIVPTGLNGIITGIILGIARIAGETAPLLFTAFGSPFMSMKLTAPMNALPLLIFNYAASPYEDWHNIAWGASFVLLVLVLILNLIAKLIASRWKIQF